MPRISAIASETTPFTLDGEPMKPPAEQLSEEQQIFWHSVVDPFPASRFQADAAPALIELCRAMSRSRKIAEELDGLRQTQLAWPSAQSAKMRAVFFQLARQARAEAALISVLSVKLRLCDQSKIEKRAAEAERRGMPVGPVPWAEAPLDDGPGKH